MVNVPVSVGNNASSIILSRLFTMHNYHQAFTDSLAEPGVEQAL